MAVSWKKLKEGSDQPSAEDIVAYLATPWAAVELGIARPGQRPPSRRCGARPWPCS
jgi:hypothetical protein